MMKSKNMPQCQIHLSWNCTCFTTGSILWLYSSRLGLLPKAQILKFGGFFFFIKLVERSFSANLMSMAITCMFTDYGSNPILVNVLAHGEICTCSYLENKIRSCEHRKIITWTELFSCSCLILNLFDPCEFKSSPQAWPLLSLDSV